MVVVTGCSPNYYIAVYYGILKDDATPIPPTGGIHFPVWSVRVPNSDPLLNFTNTALRDMLHLCARMRTYNVNGS